MTGMLASVNSVEEALLVLNANVDIIDLKQPALGALGALETELVKIIVDKIQGRRPVSATVGDLPMQPNIVFQAVKDMAETGVDYVKIGFFPGGDWLGTLEKLAPLTFPRRSVGTIKHGSVGTIKHGSVGTIKHGSVGTIKHGSVETIKLTELTEIKLIAVLFADTQPDVSFITALKKAGFNGVMLDTMNKKTGSLTQVMNPSDLAQFVGLAQKHNLLCGLAGSLRLQDIAELKRYQPDYLGFRGALCRDHQRTAQLDELSIVQIKLALGT